MAEAGGEDDKDHQRGHRPEDGEDSRPSHSVFASASLCKGIRFFLPKY